MTALIARQAAAQAAVNRFKGKPLKFGRNDCARLAAFVLMKRGHKSPMAKAGLYHSAPGAVRAMKRLGFDTLEQAVDSIGLERIAPASALMADIVMIPGEEPFGGALTVAVGNGRVLGYHEDVAGAEILQPVAYLCAWRT